MNQYGILVYVNLIEQENRLDPSLYEVI